MLTLLYFAGYFAFTLFGFILNYKSLKIMKDKKKINHLAFKILGNKRNKDINKRYKDINKRYKFMKKCVNFFFCIFVASYLAAAIMSLNILFLFLIPVSVILFCSKNKKILHFASFLSENKEDFDKKYKLLIKMFFMCPWYYYFLPKGNFTYSFLKNNKLLCDYRKAIKKFK